MLCLEHPTASASILFKGYVGKDEAQMLELLNSTQVSTSTKAKNGGKSEKLYSDVEIASNSYGGYTLKQTADFAYAYKNYDFNADVMDFDIAFTVEYQFIATQIMYIAIKKNISIKIFKIKCL